MSWTGASSERTTRWVSRAGVLAAVLAVLGVLGVMAPDGSAQAAEPAAQQPASTSTVGWLVSSGQACTATVISSTSRSLAVTAAHCVYRGSDWQLNGARFLPGYRNGTAPYGQWTVQTAWVPTAWQRGGGAAGDRGGQPVSDVAFLQLAPDQDGRRAQDVLGSQGIRFDERAGDEVTVLGYPGARGFDGERLVSCAGETTTIPMDDGDAVGVDCRSGEGASGGPWIAGQDADRAVVAVISSGESDRVYGHLFDAATERLYRQADQAG
ncbi:Secreted protein [Pseudonocardia sp. Ae717_Ps2]|uniref:trypsin-like serine peptidase n=1 Tax=Pseudonocardia sp. Ae717_Ps2 TaxID=1885573 RepID=UPI00094AEE63|nr:trypsin-like peptidase domain-containing protein [Pseudonocardia sp. Ae717_Ps2]OLM28286.1 Secreted protein [Pseudonocardia sp. Ae717_Ps2]